MSIKELQSMVAELSLEERRQLTAFLVALRQKELAGYREHLTKKIDSNDKADWISLEEFDRRIGIGV